MMEARYPGRCERLPPGRIGEGLLGLQAQTVARRHPAEAIAQAGPEPSGNVLHRVSRTIQPPSGMGGVRTVGPAPKVFQ